MTWVKSFVVSCFLLLVCVSSAGAFVAFPGGGGVVAATACDTLQENNSGEANNDIAPLGQIGGGLYYGSKFNYQGVDAKAICYACILVEKVGSPTGNVTVAIYGDTPGEPNEADILGTSDAIDASNAPAAASPDWWCFTFSTPTSALSNGTLYWIVAAKVGSNGSNYLDWARDWTCDTEDYHRSPDGVDWSDGQSTTNCLTMRIYSQ